VSITEMKLEPVGHPAEFGKRAGLHFLHRPAAMHLHRGFGDAATRSSDRRFDPGADLIS
jgi:hypothetical protein